MIHRVVARAAAAMTPAPPMQRKTVGTVIAVRSIGTILRPVLAMRILRAALTLRLLGLRLAAGDE